MKQNNFDETVIKLLAIIARATISTMNDFKFSIQLENELYKMLEEYYMERKDETTQ